MITVANSESGFAGAIPGPTSNPLRAYSQIASRGICKSRPTTGLFYKISLEKTGKGGYITFSHPILPFYIKDYIKI